MKNVAGFHPFEGGDLVGTRGVLLCRNAFGMIECHIEG